MAIFCLKEVNSKFYEPEFSPDLDPVRVIMSTRRQVLKYVTKWEVTTWEGYSDDNTAARVGAGPQQGPWEWIR